MKIAMVLNNQTGQLDVTWPNEEKHTYIVAAPTSVHVQMADHELRDGIADLLNNLVSRGIMRLVVRPSVVPLTSRDFPIRVEDGRALRSRMGFGSGEQSPGYDPTLEAPGDFAVQAPGDIAVGPGDLQLGAQRVPVGIEQRMIGPLGTIPEWIVRYSDNSTFHTTDPCSARAIAEEIYSRSPRKGY